MPSQFCRGKDALIYGIVYASHVLNVVSTYTTRTVGYSSSSPSFLTIVSLAVPAKKKAFWP